MKRVIVLLITILPAVFFQSCKSDDDTTIQNNALLGTWIFTASSINGIAVNLDRCETMSTLLFESNNMLTIHSFFQPFDSTPCEMEVFNGTWNIPSEGRITIDAGGEITEASFEINVNMLAITEVGTFEGETETSVSTFTRQ